MSARIIQIVHHGRVTQVYFNVVVVQYHSAPQTLAYSGESVTVLLKIQVRSGHDCGINTQAASCSGKGRVSRAALSNRFRADLQ
jgi:hypothetical protein